MNLIIGTKVILLNEKGEGVVSRIIDKHNVVVTLEDGFEIPFAITELITVTDPNIEPSEKKRSETTVNIPIPLPSSTKQEKKNGVYIAIVPVNEIDLSVSDFNFWIVNHTKHKLAFTFSAFNNGRFNTLENATINPFERFLMVTVEKNKIEEYSNTKLDALFFHEKEHSYQSPLSEMIKLKPSKLYKENVFKENSLLAEKALIINVSELGEVKKVEPEPLHKVDLSKLLAKKKTHFETTTTSKPHIKNNPNYEIEVDLHVEELIDDYSRLSNAQILKLQLSHLQTTLDRAIAEHCLKLVIIHGVGNGKLKQEVRRMLTENGQTKFYDASYARYGFGATEVSIL